MTAVEFAYWLQGMFELTNPATLTYNQTQLIKKHLDLVFVHDIDPRYPPEQQETLNEIHNPLPKHMDANVQWDAEKDGPRPRC